MRMVINSGKLYNVAKGVESIAQEEAEMILKDDRWMVMSRSPENVSMFAARVPEESMEEYDSGDVDTLGFKTARVTDFISDKNTDVELGWDYDSHDFYINDGDYRANFTGINTDYVEGSMDEPIKTDWPVNVVGDIDFLSDFIAKADSFVGGTSDTFIAGAREDGLYLYSRGDDDDIHTRKKWSEFDEANVDWSIGASDRSDRKEADSVFNMDFMKEFHIPSSLDAQFRIYVGDSKPIRIVAEEESGVDLAYVLTPRVQSSGDSIVNVPDNVVEEYD